MLASPVRDSGGLQVARRRGFFGNVFRTNRSIQGGSEMLGKRRKNLAMVYVLVSLMVAAAAILFVIENKREEFHNVWRIRGQQVGLTGDTAWILTSNIIAIAIPCVTVLATIIIAIPGCCKNNMFSRPNENDNAVFWGLWGMTNFFMMSCTMSYLGTNDLFTTLLYGGSMVCYAVAMNQIDHKDVWERVFISLFGLVPTAPLVIDFVYNDFETSASEKSMLSVALWIYLSAVWLTVLIFNYATLCSKNLAQTLLDEISASEENAVKEETEAVLAKNRKAIGYLSLFFGACFLALIATLAALYTSDTYNCHANDGGETGYCTWDIFSYTIGSRSADPAASKIVTKRHWNVGFWGPLFTSSVVALFLLVVNAWGFLSDSGMARYRKEMWGLVGTDWLWVGYMFVGAMNMLLSAQAAGITEIWELSAMMIIAFLFNLVVFQARRGKHPGPVLGVFLIYSICWIDVVVKHHRAHTNLPGGDFNSETRKWFIWIVFGFEALRLLLVLWFEFSEKEEGVGGRIVRFSTGKAYMQHYVHTFFFVVLTATINIWVLVGGIYYPRSDDSITTA